jgi:vacuolar-type H+-ATPase subunit F/Vma7
MVFIGDRHTALAFRLAGVESHVMSGDAQSALELLERLVAGGNIGLVILTNSIASALGKSLSEIKMKRHAPLFLEVPEFFARPGKRVSIKDQIAALMYGRK